MIRLYLDWNVLNQMKNGAHPSLRSILNSEHRFIKFYSTAHIGDIFSSFSEDKNQLAIIDTDLQFITDITDNNCIYNGKDNQTFVSIMSPQRLLEDRVESEELIKNLGLNTLIENFNEIGIEDIGKDLIKQLNDFPLNLDFSTESTESMENIRQIFPGLNEKPNFGDFFQSLIKLSVNLNKTTSYGDLRKSFQKGLKINRDKIYNSKDPVKYIEKQLLPINENGVKGLTHMINELKNNKSTTWFETVTNTFLFLDMAGFQEDQVQIKKGKKQTFKNTTEDAFHAAFASVCDIYILNDNRGYKKTIEVYNHLNINTKVFKPDDFVSYYNQCLIIDNGTYFLNLINAHINEIEPFVFPREENNGVLLLYPSSFYFFNYFNCIYAFNSTNVDECVLLLSKDKPTNGKFILEQEVDSLVSDLMRYFGEDNNLKGTFRHEEFENFINWQGRSWTLENYSLRLIQLNGFLQLYIDINEK
jgi:hypothetical protein